jgi:hypothetical protein
VKRYTHCIGSRKEKFSSWLFQIGSDKTKVRMANEIFRRIEEKKRLYISHKFEIKLKKLQPKIELNVHAVKKASKSPFSPQYFIKPKKAP